MSSESRIEGEEAEATTDNDFKPGCRRSKPEASQKHAKRSIIFSQHRQNLSKGNGFPGRHNGGRRAF